VGNLPDGQAPVPLLKADRTESAAGGASGDARSPAVSDAFVARFLVEPSGRGPLSGTRFAAKDLFDVAGHRTGCGNPAWLATHSAAKSHAAAIERLLLAGASLIGKTRTDELAYSLDGSNAHEGAPPNPAALDRLTGGSSSGAASAVAAGEIDFALATDTAGSVRVPGSYCGLVGLRPSHGRVSAAGLTALAPSFDTVGWLCRTLPMARRVAEALLDPRASMPEAAGIVFDSKITGLAEAATAAGFERLIAARPGMFREVAVPFDARAGAECLRILQGYEAWRAHGAWIESARPRFGAGVAERFAAARQIGMREFLEALREREAIVASAATWLPRGSILCQPSAPGPAPRRDSSPAALQERRARAMPMTAFASLTGRPQITLPTLHIDGAPVGVSLIGWKDGDESLFPAAERLIAAGGAPST
jgi:amidase